MTTATPIKPCSKCKQHPRQKHSTWCVICRREADRMRYARNAEEQRARQRAYRVEHGDQMRANRRRYYHEHREKMSEWARQKHARTYLKNRQHILAQQARIHEQNPEMVRAWKRAYYQRNPGRNKPNVHARRARLRGNGGTHTIQEWQTLCEHYQHTCLCCGKQEPEIKLSIDHVIPLSKGGTNDITNIQPLCLPCNIAKAAQIIDYRKEQL